MAIPESQLDTWSHQGSVTQSKDTYRIIKGAVESSGAPYASRNFSVFLQGSYGNDTNIYAESDVDVVVKLDDCWRSDLSLLTQEEKEAYDSTFGIATYTGIEFKREVMEVLLNRFGRDVDLGNKAISVGARDGRRKSDVIVAAQYRRYYSFKNEYRQSYDEGIYFFDSANYMIENYPKQHSENLTRKHQGTGGQLKPMVRIFKNIRRRLEADGALVKGVAPSYYVEGMLYNVPADKFSASYQDCFVNAVSWLQEEADRDALVCANEQHYLLRDNERTSWPPRNYETFLNAAVRLWNDW